MAIRDSEKPKGRSRTSILLEAQKGYGYDCVYDAKSNEKIPGGNKREGSYPQVLPQPWSGGLDTNDDHQKNYRFRQADTEHTAELYVLYE